MVAAAPCPHCGLSDGRHEQHVGYWDDSTGFLPLSALPHAGSEQVRFFEHARPVFVVTYDR